MVHVEDFMQIINHFSLTKIKHKSFNKSNIIKIQVQMTIYTNFLTTINRRIPGQETENTTILALCSKLSTTSLNRENGLLVTDEAVEVQDMCKVTILSKGI